MRLRPEVVANECALSLLEEPRRCTASGMARWVQGSRRPTGARLIEYMTARSYSASSEAAGRVVTGETLGVAFRTANGAVPLRCYCTTMVPR